MPDMLQAVGSHTAIIFKRETDWGTSPAAGAWSTFNTVGGESLDNAINVYNSQIIRSDRMRNASVRGTRRPGGSLPFELSAKGMSGFLQAALGGAITTTGSADPYTHVFKGNSTIFLPSYTIEKGFADLSPAKYFALKGCRVNTLSLNFGIDAIVSGTLELMAQDAIMSGTSVKGADTLSAAPLVKPFTSVQAAVYRAGSLVSVVRSATLNITNNLYGDSGFVLGDTKRQNLLAGMRAITGNATFIFQDTTYYDAAVAGTEMSMKFLCTDADSHSVEILLPLMQFLPNNPSPKIANDGPLEIQADFEALPELTTEQTDIKVTVISDEAAIDY